MNKKLSRTQRQERENLIKETAQKRPDLTYQELADMFGLNSRSHVFWIIHKPARQEALLALAQQIDEENQNAEDSLNS